MAIAEPPSGIQIIRKDSWMPREAREAIRNWTPKTDLGAVALRIITGGYGIPAEEAMTLYECVRKAVVVESELRGVVYRGPSSEFLVTQSNYTSLYAELVARGVEFRDKYQLENYGVLSHKKVTDVGVALLIDTFDNTLTVGDERYHGLGTGSVAEDPTDTALTTELTTQYTPSNTRATGTFSQPTAPQSRSVATNTIETAGVAVTEHGIFNQASNAGGILFDKSIFSVINLAIADSLQSMYTLTATSGG